MNLPSYRKPKTASPTTENVVVADLRENSTVITSTKNGSDFVKKEYKTTDFQNFSEILKNFVNEHRLSSTTVVVSVPGPVLDGKSAPARLPWALDSEKIKTDCGVENVFLINDLEAYAYGISSVSDDDIFAISRNGVNQKGNIAILAAGSGLGEAGIFYDGEVLHPFATEGGHCEFSPRTETEVEFYQFLNKIYGIVSWESVLSKQGVFNIYRFLRDVKRHPSVPELDSTTGDLDLFIDRLVHNSKELICTITINTYAEFLAREANSLVLKLKAVGGLFIGGDLPVIFQNFIDQEKFYAKFLMSDKMEILLNDVSIYLIKDKNIIEKGALEFAKLQVQN